jgi:hypothetical protein
MAGEKGLEPLLPGPKPGVLPLDYSPLTLKDYTKARLNILGETFCLLMLACTKPIKYSGS